MTTGRAVGRCPVRSAATSSEGNSAVPCPGDLGASLLLLQFAAAFPPLRRTHGRRGSCRYVNSPLITSLRRDARQRGGMDSASFPCRVSSTSSTALGLRGCFPGLWSIRCASTLRRSRAVARCGCPRPCGSVRTEGVGKCGSAAVCRCSEAYGGRCRSVAVDPGDQRSAGGWAVSLHVRALSRMGIRASCLMRWGVCGEPSARHVSQTAQAASPLWRARR